MLDESSHIISTNNQKNKKLSLKKAATNFFKGDFFLKKKSGTDKCSAKPMSLKRASSSISVVTRHQLHDLEESNVLKDLSEKESYFHVEDIERNSREKPPSTKGPLLRRPVNLLDISRHSDSHVQTLGSYRKYSGRRSPLYQVQQRRHSAMFQDLQVDPENNANEEKSMSAPSSAVDINIEPDIGAIDINSESYEVPTDFPSLGILISSTRHQQRKDYFQKKKSHSRTMPPNGTKGDVSPVSPKPRPKSKSLNLDTTNLELMSSSPTTSSGANNPSVEYQNRNIQKSSDKPPISRSSSAKSILSIGSNVSSMSMFGRNESNRKESRAILEWYNTVAKLIEKTENTITNVTTFQNTDKTKAMAKFIFEELYSTEKSFHQLLEFTYNNYMTVMQKAVQGKYALVKASDVQILFYALPEMIEASEKLLDYLQKYLDGVIYQDCTPGLALGYIFKQLESDMVAFLKYATHYKANMKSIRKARGNVYITKIENELKLQKANNRLDLADYLIAPFQRVPRYGLLIKDLLKYTDITIEIALNLHDTLIHPLLEAQNIIDGLAITMNQAQQKPTRKSCYYTLQSPIDMTTLV